MIVNAIILFTVEQTTRKTAEKKLMTNIPEFLKTSSNKIA